MQAKLHPRSVSPTRPAPRRPAARRGAADGPAHPTCPGHVWGAL